MYVLVLSHEFCFWRCNSFRKLRLCECWFTAIRVLWKPILTFVGALHTQQKCIPHCYCRCASIRCNPYSDLADEWEYRTTVCPDSKWSRAKSMVIFVSLFSVQSHGGDSCRCLVCNIPKIQVDYQAIMHSPYMLISQSLIVLTLCRLSSSDRNGQGLPIVYGHHVFEWTFLVPTCPTIIWFLSSLPPPLPWDWWRR